MADFDPYKIELVPSQWFEPQSVYEGPAAIKWGGPPLAATGQATARFTDRGAEDIEITLDGFDAEIMKILLDPLTKSIEEIAIRTSNGVFTAVSPMFAIKSSVGIGNNIPWTMSVCANQSVYVPHTRDAAEFWVAPLTNLLVHFIQRHPDLDRHPLRIYPTPLVPEGLKGNKALVAQANANRLNRLVIFQTATGLAFIEALPDYGARKERLETGRSKHEITAVMIGRLAGEPIETVEDVRSWFPSDLATAVSFAVGTEVGVPWVEFRDSHGRLCRRVAIGLVPSEYDKGHPVIDGLAHAGLGALLTLAAAVDSPLKEPQIRVAMRNAIRGGRYRGYLEERLTAIFRALECLCNHVGCGAWNLMQGLPPQAAREVRGILGTGATQVRAVQVDPNAPGTGDQRRCLNRIAERLLSTPANVDRDFGCCLADLLRHVGLVDADLMDNQFAKTPRPDGRSWTALVSHYRGMVTHEGYLSSGTTRSANGHGEAVVLWRHLHDILLRCILKLLKYQGQYQPAVAPYTVGKPPDWVTMSTAPNELGYG